MRMIIFVPLALIVACATDLQSNKSLLSERTAQQILTACNARPGKFLPARKQPPSISITIPAAEQATEGVAPTMTCVHDRLQPFRYGYIQINDSTAPPD